MYFGNITRKKKMNPSTDQLNIKDVFLHYDIKFQEELILLLGQKIANFLLCTYSKKVNYYIIPESEKKLYWNDFKKIVPNKSLMDKIYKIAEELAHERNEQLIPILLDMDDCCFSVQQQMKDGYEICLFREKSFAECHRCILGELWDKNFSITLHNFSSSRMLSKPAPPVNGYVFCKFLVGEDCMFTINVNKNILKMKMPYYPLTKSANKR